MQEIFSSFTESLEICGILGRKNKEGMNEEQLIAAAAAAAKLSTRQAESLEEAFFGTIAQNLASGEPVEVDGLGKFYTVKYPGEVVEDPPGSGHTAITLPEVEPEYEADPKLVTKVLKSMKEHPELFRDAPSEDASSSPKEGVSSATTPPSESPPPVKAPEKPLSRPSTVQYVDLSHTKVEREILSLVPLHLAKQLSLAPIDLKAGVLTIAMVDPEDFDAQQMVRKETGLATKPVLTTRDDLQAVLDQYTGLQAEVQEVIDQSDLGISAKEIEEAAEEDLDQTNDNAPTARIVSSLLRRAVKERASDIHIEPYERKVVVRFRVDGVLVKRVELPKEIQLAVTSRLKIMANLKIDEQRLPQDGRLNIVYDRRQIDFRLSTIPVVNGEKVVMRILDKSVGIIGLEEVGVSDHGFEVLSRNITRSHGMILVTGPTGSGKTTSLYAVLGKLMSDDVNILTLEDPVEYRIESINQSQVHAEIGYSFAAGLRAVVRQDPDVVMLGEIRDQETADMAIHAALTGHVVLSTLHTNDAAGTFPRLIDMGM